MPIFNDPICGVGGSADAPEKAQEIHFVESLHIAHREDVPHVEEETGDDSSVVAVL